MILQDNTFWIVFIFRDSSFVLCSPSVAVMCILGIRVEHVAFVVVLIVVMRLPFNYKHRRPLVMNRGGDASGCLLDVETAMVRLCSGCSAS